jgi:hypothetical protein
MISASGDSGDGLTVKAIRNVALAIGVVSPDDDFSRAGERKRVPSASRNADYGLRSETCGNVALAIKVGSPGDDLTRAG